MITAGKKQAAIKVTFICLQQREHFVKYSPFHGGYVCTSLRPCILDWYYEFNTYQGKVFNFIFISFPYNCHIDSFIMILRCCSSYVFSYIVCVGLILLSINCLNLFSFCLILVTLNGSITYQKYGEKKVEKVTVEVSCMSSSTFLLVVITMQLVLMIHIITSRSH